jgi:hypothetical protein
METFTITSAPEIIRGPGTGVANPARKAALGFVLVLAFLPAVGCATKKMASPPPPAPYQSIVGTENDRLQESLFKGDQAVLSNQDIDRILTARITLADRHRLRSSSPEFSNHMVSGDRRPRNAEFRPISESAWVHSPTHTGPLHAHSSDPR